MYEVVKRKVTGFNWINEMIYQFMYEVMNEWMNEMSINWLIYMHAQKLKYLWYEIDHIRIKGVAHAIVRYIEGITNRYIIN